MSLLVADPTGPSGNGSKSKWQSSVQLSRGFDITAPDRADGGVLLNSRKKKKKKNHRKEHLPSLSQTAVNKSSFTFLTNSKRTPKYFLH